MNYIEYSKGQYSKHQMHSFSQDRALTLIHFCKLCIVYKLPMVLYWCVQFVALTIHDAVFLCAKQAVI